MFTLQIIQIPIVKNLYNPIISLSLVIFYIFRGPLIYTNMFIKLQDFHIGFSGNLIMHTQFKIKLAHLKSGSK